MLMGCGSVLVGAEGEYRRRRFLSDLLSVIYNIYTVSLGLGAFHGAADGAGGEGCYC